MESPNGGVPSKRQCDDASRSTKWLSGDLPELVKALPHSRWGFATFGRSRSFQEIPEGNLCPGVLIIRPAHAFTLRCSGEQDLRQGHFSFLSLQHVLRCDVFEEGTKSRHAAGACLMPICWKIRIGCDLCGTSLGGLFRSIL